MAKRLTVFYSWQSDSPSNLNRSFIERALQKALERLHSDATLENALRDTKIELDKDTQGVAGSPPIAETILQKIEDCAVFVADLSFVGESKNGFTNTSGKPRQFPNPNVLIEYGYALRCHSHAKLVGIMNTAYGKPGAESLPFDLRHLRWPISYHLTDSSAPDKIDQFEKLVETLVKAIGLILSNNSSSIIPVEIFLPQKTTTDAATFFDKAEDSIVDGPFGAEIQLNIPKGSKAYLRLYPSAAVPHIDSELEAKKLATSGSLVPLGHISGRSTGRNFLGGIVYEARNGGNVYRFTQLFLNRELWGVDAGILNAEVIKEHYGANSELFINIGYIEDCFVETLQNYLLFSKDFLKLPIPLKIEAGLVGVKGYSMTSRHRGFVGKSLRDVIQWTGEANYDRPAWEIIEPFIDKIWSACGVPRTSQNHTEYIQRFTAQG
jgi:hypothetical protein